MEDQAQQEAAAAADSALMEDLERQHMETVQERDRLREQLAAAQSKVSLLETASTQHAASAQAAMESQNSLALEKLKLKAANEQNQNAQERLDRIQLEGDALRQEISRLNDINTNLQKEVTSAKVQATLKESDVIPLYHEKERLQRELDAVQAHADFLQQECVAKQKDYQHIQQQARDRTLQLQLQLEHTNNELEKRNTQCTVLEKVETELQTNLNEMTLAHQLLQTEKQQLETSAALERQEHNRVADLHKEQLARYKQRLEDVERDNDNLRNTAQSALQTGDQEIETVRKELTTKYSALLQKQAADFEAKLKALKTNENRLVLGGAQHRREDTDEEDGPVSLTDLLEQRESARAELSTERVRRKKVELMLKRIQKDMSEHAPRWIQQKEELDLALERLEEYESRLKSALQERSDARADEKEARKEVAEMEKKLEFRASESRDLAKQVQALLVRASTGGANDTNVPVTVAEIQAQNMQLLSENRRLSRSVTDLESTMEAEGRDEELQEARAELQTLNEQRKQQETMVQKIVQQRDLYRALLNSHDAKVLGSETDEASALTVAQKQTERAQSLSRHVTELESEVAKLQSDLDNTTRDKENAEERRNRYEIAFGEISQANNELQRELVNAKGDTAKALSESAYHQERCKRLEDSNERIRSEAEREKASRLEYQKINTQLENSMLFASAGQNDVESKNRQLEAKALRLEAQVSEARSMASRKAEENALLLADNARQGTMIESIRRIEANLSTKDASEKERIQKELESAMAKLESTSSSHAEEIKSLNLEISDLRAKASDLERTSHTHQKDALTAQKELMESKAQLQSLKASGAKTEAQLRAAKRKLGEDTDTEDVEVQLQARVDELETELAESKKEIDSLQRQVEEYRTVVQAGEAELAEVQKTTDNFKAELNRELETLRNQLAATEKDKTSGQQLIRDLTNDLAGQRGERDKLTQDFQAQIAALETQIRSNDDVVKTAKTSTASMTQDIEKYRQEASKAQKNYERELSVHAEARVLLREAQEAVEDERRRKIAAEEELQAVQSALDQGETVFNAEKEKLTKEIEQLNKFCEDKREENKTLHNQIESINSKMSAAGDRATTLPSDAADGEDDDGEMQRLQGIVTFLRSENEVMQNQLDAANRATTREKATVESLRRSLDLARAELTAAGTNDGAGESEANISNLEQKVKAGEDQMNLLKDSNKLLREESATLEAKLEKASKELAIAQKAAEPSDTVKRKLEDKIKSLEAERTSLLRELESWKSRMQSMVDNLQNDEHKQLVKQVDQLSKEKEELNAWKTTSEQESTRLRLIAKNLKQKINDQISTIEHQKTEISKLKTSQSKIADSATELKQLGAKVKALEAANKAIQTDYDGAVIRSNKLREILRNNQKRSGEQEQREKGIVLQLEEANRRLKVFEKSAAVDATKGKPESTVANQAAASDASSSISSIPKVPEGGFKFGPSATRKNPELRASAVPFVPPNSVARKETQPVKPDTGSTEEESSLKAKLSRKNVAAGTSSAGVKRNAPGTEQELSMKEKLILKRKRQNADEQEKEMLMKRKRQAEETIAKAKEAAVASSAAGGKETSEGEATNDQKKIKVEEKGESKVTKASTDDKKVKIEEKSESQGADTSAVADEVMAEATTTEKIVPSAPGVDIISPTDHPVKDEAESDIGDFPTAKTDEKVAPVAEAPKVDVDEKQVEELAPSSAGLPLLSGAFFDTKAPGKGNEIPTFSFGSSSIKLPTPSGPTTPTASQFGVFDQSNSFAQGKPLFGAPVAPIAEETTAMDADDNEGKSEVMDAGE